MLSRSKREQEGSKYNVEILKRRVYHQQLSNLLDSVQAPTDAIVSAAGDHSSTYPLRMRCDRIIQQAKSQLMLVHVTAAELKARQCDDQFHLNVHKMEQTRKDPVSTERLTEAMVAVLQRRFKHIEQRIQRLYQLKVNFFDEAPAATSKYL